MLLARARRSHPVGWGEKDVADTDKLGGLHWMRREAAPQAIPVTVINRSGRPIAVKDRIESDGQFPDKLEQLAAKDAVRGDPIHDVPKPLLDRTPVLPPERINEVLRKIIEGHGRPEIERGRERRAVCAHHARFTGQSRAPLARRRPATNCAAAILAPSFAPRDVLPLTSTAGQPAHRSSYHLRAFVPLRREHELRRAAQLRLDGGRACRARLRLSWKQSSYVLRRLPVYEVRRTLLGPERAPKVPDGTRRHNDQRYRGAGPPSIGGA